MRRLEVLRHLRSLNDVVLVLRIFGFAVAVPWLVRRKLSTVATVLEPTHAPLTPEPASIHKIAGYVDLVLRVGRPLIRPGCLTRGLTLYYFLSRAGLDVTLCFGMGNVGGTYVGHCWVAKDGEPFLEARDPRPVFTVVYSFPDERPSRGSDSHGLGGGHGRDDMARRS